MTLDDIDLPSIVAELRRRFGDVLTEGYLDGRTTLRDAVMSHLGCSSLEAESLVDTMETSGYLDFPRFADATHSQRAAHWRLRLKPTSML